MDIIDITTRLTYELNDKGLTEAANALGQQIKQLSILQQEEKKLQANRSSDLAAQKQQEQQIIKNREQQTQLTQEINRSTMQNRMLLITMNQESGILRKIGDQINDLKRTRETAHKSAISGINQEITLLERQRKSLLSQGTSTGSFLSAFLPNGKLSTQIGQGLLYGLGIGSGFGIITRLVDELVGQLSEAGSAILNTASHQDELRQKTESLTNAIEGEVGAWVKLNEQVREINAHTGDLQRQLELVKAIGVVNGQTADARQREYDAQQKINQDNISKATQERDIRVKTRDAVLAAYSAVKSAGVGTPNLPISTPVGGGGGVLGAGSLAGSTIADIGNFARIEQAFLKSGGNQDELNKILLDIRKQGVTNLYAPDLTSALNKVLTAQGLEVQKANEAVNNASNKVTIDREQQLADSERRAYELNRQLAIRLRGLDAETAQQRIKDAEDLDRETEGRIKNRNEIARREELSKVDDDIQLAINDGKYTSEVADKYGAIKADINKKYNAQILRETHQYHLEQIKEQKSLNAAEIKEQLSNANAQLALEVQQGEDTLGTRNNIAQLQTRAELDEVNTKYDALFKAAYKSGNDITQLTEEYQQAILLVELHGQQRSVDALEGYYDDRLRVLKEYEQDEQLSIKGNTDALEEAYRQQYEDGKISLKKYLRERKLIRYQGDLDELQQTKTDLEKELQLAQDALNQLPSNTPGRQRRAAERRVIGLQNQLSGVNQSISTTAGTPGGVENFIFGDASLIKDKGERFREELKLTADAYGQLASSAIGAFQDIYKHQQELLEREIDIRQKRVDVATRLAERGNTEVLKLEQERLDESIKKQAEYAKKQEILNAALALSQAIVAVATAAAQSGAGAIVVVPAVIAALIAGYSAVRAITTDAMPSFAEGVEGFDGKGTGTSDSNVVRISKGESILTAKATREYAGIPTMMNDGTFPRFAEMGQASKGIINLHDTNKKLDMIASRLENLEFRAENKMDANGVSQMINAYTVKQKVKWANS